MAYAASLAQHVDSAENRFLGAAILGRLRYGAYRPIFDGGSYRSRSPSPLPGEPKTTLAKHPKYTKS